MPKQVEIEIYQIAKTKLNNGEVDRWLRHLDAYDFADNLPDIDECTDPAFLVALSAKRCYMSFEVGLNPNITKVRQDLTEYLDNVLRQRHVPGEWRCAASCSQQSALFAYLECGHYQAPC